MQFSVNVCRIIGWPPPWADNSPLGNPESTPNLRSLFLTFINRLTLVETVRQPNDHINAGVFPFPCSPQLQVGHTLMQGHSSQQHLVYVSLLVIIMTS